VSQIRFQDAFPNGTSNTFEDPQGLNSLLDGIWDLRRQQGRFDPLHFLKVDMMHDILLSVVSLQDITENGVWGTEVTPSNRKNGPLVLTSVSRRWSQFITSSPQLWSHLLIDTNDGDALGHLQLSLLLSCETPLFIALHGSAVVSDAIVMALLQVGDRIKTMIYPRNVSPSTLAKFRLYLGPVHHQIESNYPWHELEVQSVIGTRQHTYHYSFPTSIQSLWMDALFPLSNTNIVMLSHFQSLSFLSVRLGHDTGIYPAAKSRLDLPNLARLRLQMTVEPDQRVEIPVSMSCKNLKQLHLQYMFEINPDSFQEYLVPWLEFDAVDALQELQLHLAIHAVTNDGSFSSFMWQGKGQLQPEQLQRLEQLEQFGPLQIQDPQQQLVRLQRLNRRQRQALQRLEMQRLEQQRFEQQQRKQLLLLLSTSLASLVSPQQPGEVQVSPERLERLQSLERQRLSLAFMQTPWGRWLNPLISPESVQRTSLEVIMPKDEEAYGFVRDVVEESLLLEMPQLTELATSRTLHVFPEHLQKLCLHDFSIPDSLSLIDLPSVVSLEIKANTLQHLSIVRYVWVPQLRDLRVQVQDSSGESLKYDLRYTTNNQLDHISLIIGICHNRQGDNLLVFHLPQTHTLNVSSPYVALHLFFAQPALPLLHYALHADIGAMPATSDGQINEPSTPWQENLMTEWTNPYHGIPNLTKLGTLTSLQKIVLDDSKYNLYKQSPTDELFKLLAENIYVCPDLTSIAVAQCPSHWPSFLHDLQMRNHGALLSNATKCIEELSFHQPLHATIAEWLSGAIKAKFFNVTERPPVREGNAWPMRPFGECEYIFRSCYVCHITGMELGCLEHETQSWDCGRERGEGPKIRAL
jgi:hypothetical protein